MLQFYLFILSTSTYHNYYEDDNSRGPSSLPVSGYESFATPGSTTSLPGQEEVVRRTEAITRCIQELLVRIWAGLPESFSSLLHIFPNPVHFTAHEFCKSRSTVCMYVNTGAKV